MRKWTTHHFYNQYLLTLWLAFLLLTSCNTDERAPISLQASPAMPAIDTIQANPGMVNKDTAYFIDLLFEGIENSDLNRIILGKNSGAPIEALNKTGNTPLIETIKNQNVNIEAIIHYLIQQGADPNQKNQAGYAPLHYAVRDIENNLGQNGKLNSRISPILHGYRADINIQDHQGNTPLHHAILARAYYHHTPQENYTRQREHIQILLKAGAQLLPNNNGDTPLTLAQSINGRDIVALLEKVQEEIIRFTIPSIGTLSKRKLVRYLLSPSNSNEDQEQKIKILRDQLSIDLIEKNNIHINTNFNCGNKLIHLATQTPNLPIIHFLLQYDPSQINYVNLIGQTPLHIAAEKGYLPVVQCLVRYPNIKLNAQTEGGYSPLYYAFLHRHNHVLDCLVQSRANINVTDCLNKTPLHNAAYNGSLGLVHYLLQNNANINVTDGLIKTPLYFAVDNGSLELVRYFIQNGAKINVIDCYHNTPLHCAAYNGYFGIVCYLLHNGANINEVNYDGKTLLDIATKDEQSDMVEYLISQGALLGKKMSF
jgi:ankyrin repeat protein